MSAISRFAAEVEAQRKYGVDEEGVREFLADVVGKRMDGIMLNVARACRRNIERMLKDRVKERMDALRKMLYPKRQRGKAWPRGKADAETYRWVEEVYALLEAKDNEMGEPGDFEAETERLEHALEELEEDGEKAEKLLAEVNMRRLFGQWRKLSYEDALKAAEVFEKRVLEGRRAWDELMEKRRAHVNWLKAQVRKRKNAWKRAGSNAALTEQVRESAQRQGRAADTAKMGLGMFTNFAGKMDAWRRELGGVFVERMKGRWAEMNIAIKSRNDEMLRWASEAVAWVAAGCAKRVSPCPGVCGQGLGNHLVVMMRLQFQPVRRRPPLCV